jgi:hypothetical protein
MSNLKSYSNLYADLAQGAYTKRDKHKMLSTPDDNQSESLKTKGYAEYSFGDGTKPVFLQPDVKVRAADGSSKSVMADSGTGFQSYVVTDKSRLADSKHACLAVRGSDNWGNPHDLLTDWIENDGVFAFANTGIAQSKDAELALKATIAKLPKTVKLDVTGHSLGTMVSAQGVAELVRDDPKAFDRIGKVVLWDGPDTT